MNKIKVLMNTSNESYTEGLSVSDERIMHVIAENGTSISRELPQFQIFGGDVTTPKITSTPALVSTIPNSFLLPRIQIMQQIILKIYFQMIISVLAQVMENLHMIL